MDSGAPEATHKACEEEWMLMVLTTTTKVRMSSDGGIRRGCVWLGLEANGLDAMLSMVSLVIERKKMNLETAGGIVRMDGEIVDG